MADQFDHASELEQLALQQNLAAQQARAAMTPKVHAVGYCRNPNCANDFPEGDKRLFCDARCATQAERYAR